MKPLWDSSEIKEAAALFGDVLEKPEPVPEPASPGIYRPKRTGPISRGDRLDDALLDMCDEAEFHGALLADKNGLTVATCNCPIDKDVFAAFTPTLGDVLEKSARLFNKPEGNMVVVDIDNSDRLVMRKFPVNNEPYFLVIISSRNIDGREHIDQGITDLALILA